MCVQSRCDCDSRSHARFRNILLNWVQNHILKRRLQKSHDRWHFLNPSKKISNGNQIEEVWLLKNVVMPVAASCFVCLFPFLQSHSVSFCKQNLSISKCVSGQLTHSCVQNYNKYTNTIILAGYLGNLAAIHQHLNEVESACTNVLYRIFCIITCVQWLLLAFLHLNYYF